MIDYQKEEDKRFMLQRMQENNWDTKTNENSSFEEVKSDYDDMIDEFEAIEDGMYPNGRDFDAENPDD